MNDFLSELAQMAPKVAAEAALALCQSPLEVSRQRGAQLCAEIASASGAKLTTHAMRALCARMLQALPPAAESFARAAPGMVRANGAGLVEELPAELCMRIESWIPGFATKLSPSTLARNPELCGLMSVKGILTQKKLSDAVGWAGMRCEQNQKHLTRTDCNKSAGDARAPDFFKSASKVDPSFESKFWGFYWDEKRRTNVQDHAWCDQSFAKAAVLPGTVDPFEGLPELAHLGEVRERRFAALVEIITKKGENLDRLHELGRYLARAGKPNEKLKATWANDILRGSAAQDLTRFGSVSLKWLPDSDSANYLCLLLGSGPCLREGKSGSVASFKAQSKKWVALAEGLAQGGAPSPIWSCRKGQGSHLGPEPKAGPLLFLAKGGEPTTSGPAWSWLLADFDPREAQHLRTWSGFKGHIHRVDIERLLENIEIMSAVGSHPIRSSTPSIRI